VLDRAIGVRFPVSDKNIFSCEFLDFRSGADDVPFRDDVLRPMKKGQLPCLETLG
jgi:hypothetical protein